MSLATIQSRALIGIYVLEFTVETHLSDGLPPFAIVGLPKTAVKESKERVRSAIINSGLEFPTRRITVNPVPDDLPKAGGRYDPAIALSIVIASGQLERRSLEGMEVLGGARLGWKHS
jgi:magnesium chelatase family protein